MSELISRFPQFTNPDAFIQLCDQLLTSGNISQDDNLLQKRYHYSIIHKLKSAVYSLEGIRRITATGSHLPNLTTTSGTITTQPEFDDGFKINYFQDNFFSSLIGSFDILSLKLNSIFNSVIPDIRSCYFSNLVRTISATSPNGVIENYLSAILASQWYQQTCPFRICLIHRQQFDYEIRITVVAGSHTFNHLLPDNPLSIPYTYNNQTEIVSFCEDKLNHFVDVINDVDGLLIQEVQRVGHVPF